MERLKNDSRDRDEYLAAAEARITAELAQQEEDKPDLPPLPPTQYPRNMPKWRKLALGYKSKLIAPGSFLPGDLKTMVCSRCNKLLTVRGQHREDWYPEFVAGIVYGKPVCIRCKPAALREPLPGGVRMVAEGDQ